MRGSKGSADHLKRKKVIVEKTDNLEAIDRVEAEDGAVVEVLQYRNVKGSADVRTAENVSAPTRAACG